MSQFSNFFKENKTKREVVNYIATRSLVDENGEPLQWQIKPITARENDILRDECNDEIPVKGTPGLFRDKIDSSKYISKLLCACIIYPNLNNQELQDSYGVMKAEDLIKEIVDNIGEYNNFISFIQDLNGFSSIDKDIEQAKN